MDPFFNQVKTLDAFFKLLITAIFVKNNKKLVGIDAPYMFRHVENFYLGMPSDGRGNELPREFYMTLIKNSRQ